MRVLKYLCLFWSIMMMQMSAVEFKSAEPKEVPLIPRQLLFGNPEKTSPQISFDGKYLAYLAPNAEGVLNVWVKNLQQEKPDDVVTNDQYRGIRKFLWQYDNEHVLYIQDKGGDENWHLYQTQIKTKQTRDLTPFEGVRVDLLDYDYRRPDMILVQMNKRDKSCFDVYQINLKTGACDLKAQNPDCVFQWLADNDLQVRAAVSYTQQGETLIRVRDTEESFWRELLKIDPQEMDLHLVSFSPNNESLYLVSSLQGNTNRLLEVDFKNGHFRVLAEDPQYDVGSVMLHPTKHTLEAVGIERDRLGWVFLNPRLKTDFDYLQANCQDIRILSRDLQDRYWIVADLSDVRPAYFHLYDRENKKLTFLFSENPKLEKYDLSSMRPISFQARDGMTLHGYLTLPAGKEPKNLPTILLVHGGPWTRDSWGFRPNVQWLANRGYAVLQINYRGSTGYGKNYVNAGDREWAEKMHTDLLDGKQWVIRQGYADPSKIAIFGGSYGGYATLVGLAFTPDEFCCGVDIVGPSNLMTLLKTIPPYWGPLKAQMERRLGKLEEEEFLKSRSPLFKADQIKKPLLIGQGANDPRVKQSESDQIVAAMRNNQKEVLYLLFEDEGHGFARPENRLKFYAATEQFLAKYLGGRQEVPAESENWESLKR
jgi:dipeptidyl aminopeptidase/acylaminoacyl peptidase